MSWRARFSPNITNIVVFLNPKDPNCFGVRSWIRNILPEIRLLNPETGFSIQELSFGEPTMYVGYTLSDQRSIRLAGATEDETDDIMAALTNYAATHALREKGRDDATRNADYRIVNFGFAESFNTKIDSLPLESNGQELVDGIDDQGQMARVYARNNGLKLLP
eukprot:GILK01025495.1.p1 GENE.GILK01025495.1~~GILK01025495.1.p1  ORF type:complete len:164 (-),score=5.71 GILK01025495.1:47-538(-)